MATCPLLSKSSGTLSPTCPYAASTRSRSLTSMMPSASMSVAKQVTPRSVTTDTAPCAEAYTARIK
jgi:hypothetical protein